KMARHKFRAQLDHLSQAVLRRACRDEGEVAPLGRGGDVGIDRRERGVAAVDRVRRRDDRALALLAENDREARDGRPGRLNQILEDVAGPYAGQLVDVADDEQVRPQWNGL